MEKSESTNQISGELSRISALTESFAGFGTLIERLNKSYLELENRFETLNRQLEETNFRLRQALQENQKVRKFLHELTESVPSGIVVYDLDGRITMLNKAARALFQTDQERAMQNGLEFAADTRPELSARQTIQNLKPILSEEKEITLRGGQKLTLSFSAVLLYDEDARVIGALELYHDISKLRGLEDEILRVRTLAALGEMAATVAHEVRNPLGGILGFAALLRKDFDEGDPRCKTVDKIIKGVENLDRSVSALLTYAQEAHPEIKLVKLKPFLEELVANFQMTLARSDESSRVDLLISPESLEWAFDPGQIGQCLLNLLLNAHQAQTGSSEIRLSALADNKLSLIVADSGTGMGDHVKQKLFTPFFTTRKAGTGLGLATVKKLILQHKGEIRIDSRLGQGTDVTLEIPANLA